MLSKEYDYEYEYEDGRIHQVFLGLVWVWVKWSMMILVVGWRACVFICIFICMFIFMVVTYHLITYHSISNPIQMHIHIHILPKARRTRTRPAIHPAT